MAAHKKYSTEEERLQAIRETKKRYRETHKQSISEYNKKYNKFYYENNKEKELERIKKYQSEHSEEMTKYKKLYYKKLYETIEGRSYFLWKAYILDDRLKGRIGEELPEDYITVEYIKQTIQQPCIYCGETDWHKIGLDRIDNDKPHLKSNCVPCCWECNRKRKTKPFEEFYKQRKRVD